MRISTAHVYTASAYAALHVTVMRVGIQGRRPPHGSGDGQREQGLGRRRCLVLRSAALGAAGDEGARPGGYVRGQADHPQHLRACLGLADAVVLGTYPTLPPHHGSGQV